MSDANIWTPGSGAPIVSAEYRVLTQRFTATAGQTVFSLTNFTYEPSTGSIGVYISGLKQQAGTDFAETSSASFTLNEPCLGGEVILAEGYTAAAAVVVSPLGTDYLAKVNNLSDLPDAGAARSNLGLVIGSTVQAYDADTAKTDVAQNFTATQRSAPLTDNDLSFDISAKQNFTCTWSGPSTLIFAGMASAAGQSGWIKFVQSGTGTVGSDAHAKISAANLTKLGTAGTYVASYYCDGTDVYVGIGVYS